MRRALPRRKGAGLADGASANKEADTAAAVRVLRTPATIRERCASIAAAAESGESRHFSIDRSKFPIVAERVARLTKTRYPDLQVPYHSRWRHFEAGGDDRKDELDRSLAGRSAEEIARAQLDLVLVSVLLDAGAGPRWRFVESFAQSLAATRYARSEGLAVASFRAFMKGRFSSDRNDPYRVDAQALMRIDASALAAIFQVDATNPLVGLEGRAMLMRGLGEALRDQPQWFGHEGRPGTLFDRLGTQAASSTASSTLSASQILGVLLDTLSGIWPSGQCFDGCPVGDVWPHPHAGGRGPSAGLVPFHKLSQWLTYSLIEPFEWAGVRVDGLDALTALPEYRNGGLLLDAGLVVPRDMKRIKKAMNPDHPWIIEWRALTIALIDELAVLVRDLLHVDANQLPLARILEGGTWAAGRAIAAELRPGGAPPVTVESDGTVF